MRRAFLCFAAAVLLLQLSAGVREVTAQAPELPESVLAAVEIKSLSDLANNLGEFSGAVSGGPPTALPIQMLIPRLLEIEDPDTVDLGSPIRMVVLEAPGHSHPVVVFGVKDTEAYLASLMGETTQEEEWPGILRYEGTGPFSAIGTAGNLVALSDDPSAVKGALDLIEGGQLTEKPLLPDGDLVAVVRLKRLLDEVTRTSGNPFDSFRALMTTVTEMTLPGGGPAMPAMTNAMLDAEIDAAEDIARQLDSVLLALSFGASGIDARRGIRVTPGGPLATYIGSVPAGDLDLLSYMPADCMMGGAAKLGDLTPFGEWYAEMLPKMYAAVGTEPEKVGAFAEMIKDTLALCGGEMCFAMSTAADGSMSFIEAIAVKDPVALRTRLTEIATASEAMSAVYESMGMGMKMEVNPSAAVYKGYEVDEWRMRLSCHPPEGMEEGAAERMVRQQQQAVEAIFGGPEMVYHSTFHGKVLLFGSGKDSLAGLKRALDGEITPLSPPAEWRPAVGARAIGYLSLGEFANWYLRLISNMVELPMLPIDLGALEFEKGPGIWMAAHCSENAAEWQVRVPAAELRTIVDGIQRAMQAPTLQGD